MVLNRNLYRFSPSAKSYFNFLTLPSVNHRIIMDKTLFRPLVNTGIINLLDRFWVGATEIEQNGTISLVYPSSTAMTLVNTPTWTQHQGWTGNGTTQYINTNFNPNSQFVNFVRDSACTGVYQRNSTTAGAMTEMGQASSYGSNGNQLSTNFSANIILSMTHGSGFLATSNGGSQGLFTTRRTASTAIAHFKNGISFATGSTSSSGVISRVFYLLATNNGGATFQFSTAQLAVAFAAAGNIDQAMVYAIIQSYMTALGTQV